MPFGLDPKSLLAGALLLFVLLRVLGARKAKAGY